MSKGFVGPPKFATQSLDLMYLGKSLVPRLHQLRVRFLYIEDVLLCVSPDGKGEDQGNSGPEEDIVNLRVALDTLVRLFRMA